MMENVLLQKYLNAKLVSEKFLPRILPFSKIQHNFFAKDNFGKLISKIKKALPFSSTFSSNCINCMFTPVISSKLRHHKSRHRVTESSLSVEEVAFALKDESLPSASKYDQMCLSTNLVPCEEWEYIRLEKNYVDYWSYNSLLWY